MLPQPCAIRVDSAGREEARARRVAPPRAGRGCASIASALSSNVAEVGGYNYEHFDAYVESGEDEREFAAFPNMLHAGERAPDGELTLLDGERVRLSELWRQQGLMLEFGSFT